jgi:hypothetical protein
MEIRLRTQVGAEHLLGSSCSTGINRNLVTKGEKNPKATTRTKMGTFLSTEKF